MKETNNKMILSGVFNSEPTFSHEVYGEKFYTVGVTITRTSGTNDNLIMLVSGRLNNFSAIKTGSNFYAIGEVRTHNNRTEIKTRLEIYFYCLELNITEDSNNDNEIYIEGFICKSPVYRKTPLGRISDVIVAVNRSYGKSDYIPCVVWGRNAEYIANIEVGTRIRLKGRLQSREYTKVVDDKPILKTAYEISVASLEIIEEESENAERKAN